MRLHNGPHMHHPTMRCWKYHQCTSKACDESTAEFHSASGFDASCSAFETADPVKMGMHGGELCKTKLAPRIPSFMVPRHSHLIAVEPEAAEGPQDAGLQELDPASMQLHDDGEGAVGSEDDVVDHARVVADPDMVGPGVRPRPMIPHHPCSHMQG